MTAVHRAAKRQADTACCAIEEQSLVGHVYGERPLDLRYGDQQPDGSAK